MKTVDFQPGWKWLTSIVMNQLVLIRLSFSQANKWFIVNVVNRKKIMRLLNWSLIQYHLHIPFVHSRVFSLHIFVCPLLLVSMLFLCSHFSVLISFLIYFDFVIISPFSSSVIELSVYNTHTKSPLLLTEDECFTLHEFWNNFFLLSKNNQR